MAYAEMPVSESQYHVEDKPLASRRRCDGLGMTTLVGFRGSREWEDVEKRMQGKRFVRRTADVCGLRKLFQLRPWRCLVAICMALRRSTPCFLEGGLADDDGRAEVAKASMSTPHMHTLR